MSIIISFLRFLFRFFLIVVSFASGITGAYGLFCFFYKGNSLASLVITNANSWLSSYSISNTSLSTFATEYTQWSKASVSLPITFVIIGAVAWITQMGFSKKELYHRVRFSHPSQVSPLAWFLVIAGVIATVYVISNWNYVDHTVAILVIVANILSILWNMSIIR